MVFVQVNGPLLVFGERFTGHVGDLNNGTYIIAGACALQLIASVGAKARSGFQEVHVNNAFGAVGNITTAVALVTVLTFWPSVAGALIAVYVTAVAIQVFNLVALLRQRRYLLNANLAGSTGRISALLGDGILYATAVGLIGLQREVARVMVARGGGPTESARFAIGNSILTMVMGVTIMLTAAVWPALADARARTDRAWLTRMKRLMFLGSFVYGLAVTLVIGWGGARFTSIFYGRVYQLAPLTWWLLAGYACTVILGHVRFTWLLGFGKSRMLAGIAACECAVNTLCLASFGKTANLTTAIAVLAVNHLLFSVVIQSIFVHRYWREYSR